MSSPSTSSASVRGRASPTPRRSRSAPDSIHALAEEYAIRENRLTDARSVVQTGIVRAEMLLNRDIEP